MSSPRAFPGVFLLTAALLGAVHPHAGRLEDLRAFAAAPTPGGPQPGALIPNFRLTDHLGVTRELYYESTARAVVLVFTARGSTRALATAAALRDLRARFPASEVVIWQVDSTAGADPAALAAEQTLFNNGTPVLRDEAQLLAAEFGVTRELETFVVSAGPGATLLYRGPLDDAPPGTLQAPGRRWAAEAVAAHLAGRRPEPAAVEMPAAAPRLALPAAPDIDFSTAVAPIVLRRCVSCHVPDGIAPHAYTRHADLASRADAIRGTLLTRRMAPWHADSAHGAWANDVALSPLESSTLHAWAKAGAPRGTGPDPLAARAPASAAGWELGPPDLILSIPTQSIPANGTVDYVYATVNLPFTEERWVRAAVVQPGNPRVVHHALVFEGTLFDVLAAAGGQGGFFTGFVPGVGQQAFPPGTGKRLRPGSALTFQMHYTPTGRPETDATRIGLYFASAPPARELQTRSAYASIFPVNTISIPPRVREYPREATFTPSATRDVLLYELNPHMHYRGKTFRFEALHPDGTVETLLNVPQYDFNWQTNYRFSEPRRLPAGTTIRARGSFDNSPQNPFNPDPNQLVRGGEQTWDEMFIGYLNYAELPERAAARPPVPGPNRFARAQAGQPFRLALPAPGAGVTVEARGLPEGVTLANDTLTGTPRRAGRHEVELRLSHPAGEARQLIDLAVLPAATAPEFTRQPRSVRAAPGSTVTFSAAVAATPAATYAWYVRGGEFCTTEGPELTLTNVGPAHAGDWVCVATNPAGRAASAPATLTLDFGALVNLSARASVGTGANVVIPGITVRGTRPKTLLIRAAGPALAAFGLGGTLADPVLSIFDAAGDRILFNDNASAFPDPAAVATASAQAAAFPLPSAGRDAAVLVTLPPGGYTVQVSGNGTGAAAQGVALVEVYEADAEPGALVNLSCRARVGTGGDVLIAGFAVGGTAPKRLLLRGVGPTLGNLGVAGSLANPRLAVLRSGATEEMAANDDWEAALAPAFASVGAFALPPGSRDAALVVTLPPGAYTAQVSGVGGTTGIALVEVYELP